MGPGGRPVFVRGREGRRLGTLLPVSHPVVAGHEQLFRPLVLEFDDPVN